MDITPPEDKRLRKKFYMQVWRNKNRKHYNDYQRNYKRNMRKLPVDKPPMDSPITI